MPSQKTFDYVRPTQLYFKKIRLRKAYTIVLKKIKLRNAYFKKKFGYVRLHNVI